MSAVDDYMAAIDARDAIRDEAEHIATDIKLAAAMLDKSPTTWQFAPPTDDDPRERHRSHPPTFDDHYITKGWINPSQWPTIERLMDIKRRYDNADRAVTSTLSALSPSERRFVDQKRTR